MGRSGQFADLVEKLNRSGLVLDAVPDLLPGDPLGSRHALFPVEAIAHATRGIRAIGVKADGLDVIAQRLQIVC